jgi:putative PIN family toxin of toxin-antitoxin system
VRITLDTNVLVSGHSDGPGEARQILLWILRGGHRLVLSQTIFYELEEVLQYPRIKSLYGLTESQSHRYVQMLEQVAELVDPGPLVELPLADRDDWPVLRTAIEGNADILCSNDGGFHKEAVIAFCAQYDLRIMRPAELLSLLSL